MGNPHISTAHAIGAKQAQEDTHKVAYQQGVSAALMDLGVVKTAEESTIATKLLGAIPGYGPFLAAPAAALSAPDDRSISRGINAGYGTGMGQLAGLAGGGVLGAGAGLSAGALAALITLAAKGKRGANDALAALGGLGAGGAALGAGGGAIYGGFRGAGEGIEESRRGDTLMETLRRKLDLEPGLIDRIYE